MMKPQANRTCTAFAGAKRLANGDPRTVALAMKRHLTQTPEAAILVFDDVTSAQLEFDLRGSQDDVAERYQPAEDPPAPPAGPGRPRLGVVAREVTLLPRHWEWLAAQPGGASVTLRKLVENALKETAGGDARRRAQEAAYKFMLVMAGNEPHYEDALRALFAGRSDDLKSLIADWPEDVRRHIIGLIEAVA